MSMPNPAQTGLAQPDEARAAVFDAAELETFRSELADALSIHTERADRPVDAEDDISLALQRRSERAVADIVAALERIDEGTFGLCVNCGSRIPKERLEAIPHAASCGRCQTPDPR